jgi:hypothetical protein
MIFENYGNYLIFHFYCECLLRVHASDRSMDCVTAWGGISNMDVIVQPTYPLFSH